jgi:hypothetical protein
MSSTVSLTCAVGKLDIVEFNQIVEASGFQSVQEQVAGGEEFAGDGGS